MEIRHLMCKNTGYVGFPHDRPLIWTFTAQDLRPIYKERLPVKENIPYANKTK